MLGTRTYLSAQKQKAGYLILLFITLPFPGKGVLVRQLSATTNNASLDILVHVSSKTCP